MKAIIIFVSAIMAALTTILISGFRKYDEPITLSIQSCGIEVECDEVFTIHGDRLQAVIDKPGIAAWYGNYTLDHAGQELR